MTHQEKLDKKIKEFKEERKLQVNILYANKPTIKLIRKMGITAEIKENNNIIDGLLILDSLDINNKSLGIKKGIHILYL